MRIYTKTGDKGQTRIYGGLTCSKDDIRIECNGKLDEANSFIGMLRAILPVEHGWQDGLHKIQSDLMDIMSHIATHSSMREKNLVNKPVDGPEFCEKWIDEMLTLLPESQDWFILPGGSQVSAQCHIIRTILRTAERRIVTLNKEDETEEFILKYINRLSDLFFVMARLNIYNEGFTEEKIRPFKRKRKQ